MGDRFRDADDQAVGGTEQQASRQIAEANLGTVSVVGQSRAANDELTAGNRGYGTNAGNLRWAFPGTEEGFIGISGFATSFPPDFPVAGSGFSVFFHKLIVESIL